jgi:hypothetical protein
MSKLSEAQVEDLVIRYYEQAFNQGDYDILDEVCGIEEGDFACDSNAGWAIEGRGGIEASISRQRHALRNFHISLVEIFVKGEKVTLWWTVTGIFVEPLWGQKPTGEAFTYSGASMLEFQDGRLVGGASRADMQEKFLQLQLDELKATTAAS